MSCKTVVVVLTLLRFAAMDVRSEIESVTKEGVAASNVTQCINIKTLSGVTYTKCKVTRIEPDGITVIHSKGVAKIPFTCLSEEYRKRCNYDSANAMAYARACAEQNAADWKRIEQNRSEACSVEDSMAKKRLIKAFGKGNLSRRLAEKQASVENARNGRDYKYYASKDKDGEWMLFAEPRHIKTVRVQRKSPTSTPSKTQGQTVSIVQGRRSADLEHQNSWGKAWRRFVGTCLFWKEGKLDSRGVIIAGMVLAMLIFLGIGYFMRRRMIEREEQAFETARIEKRNAERSRKNAEILAARLKVLEERLQRKKTHQPPHLK